MAQSGLNRSRSSRSLQRRATSNYGQFTVAGADPSKPNGNAINQLRTNEIAIGGVPWELREFNILNSGQLEIVPVKQTPSSGPPVPADLKNSAVVRDYINQFEPAILNDSYKVPLTFPVGRPFLGGSSLNNFDVWRVIARTALVLALLVNLLTALAGCFLTETNTKVADYGGGDFPVFYRTGQIVQAGEIRNVFDKRLQDEFANRPTPSQHGYFYHPPYEALLFWPFALLPYQFSFWCWTLIQIAMMWSAVRVLVPEFPALGARLGSGIVRALFFAFFPVSMVIYWGQDSGLLLLLVVLAFRYFVRAKDGSAGIYLALALFKFQHILPLIAVLALRGKRRLLLGFASTALLLVGISWLMVGTSGFAAYWRVLWDHGVEETSYMANLYSLLRWIGLWNGFTVALSLGLLLLCGIQRAQPREQFALAVLGSQLVSYHGGIYDAVLLIIPLFAALDLCCDSHISFRYWPFVFFFSPLCLVVAFFKLWPLLAVPTLLLVFVLTVRPEPQIVPVPILAADSSAGRWMQRWYRSTKDCSAQTQ